jgi:hypothetical protein
MRKIILTLAALIAIQSMLSGCLFVGRGHRHHDDQEEHHDYH